MLIRYCYEFESEDEMALESKYVLETERLRLRTWRDSDLEPFHEMSNCPHVMEYFPGMMTQDECVAAMQRINDHFEKHGFGYWAVEHEDDPFIGFVGIAVPRFEAEFTPCVEIGWRLKKASWGFGFATEAARRTCEFAFSELKLDSLVAMTAPENTRSQNVMQKIGMTRDENGDFDHPLVEDGHPLKRHVLFRLSADQWRQGGSANEAN